MIKTKKTDEIVVNSYFTSKTDEEIALNMSKVIAQLINRDIDNNGSTETKKQTVAITI